MTVADESEDHDEHHLPAVEDWPKGFGEASWWPFVTATGAAVVYVGAALFVLGRGDDGVVAPAVGPATFLAGLTLFVAGLYGWTYHGFVVDFWSREGRGGDALRWGMILFLVTEVATFGAGFVYYFYVRVRPWEPGALPHLLGSLILVNTAVLVVSSVTLHHAHRQLRRGKRGSFLRWLGVTLALGVLFVGGQVWEYYQFVVREGFVVGTGEALERVFASAFYGLTGLHGLHVTLGAVLLAILFVRALGGQYSAERDLSVTTVSMYWHFVDAVWILLVVSIYVGGSV